MLFCFNKTAVYFEHKITSLVVGALACLSLTGCRDQDFDWEAAKNQKVEYTFRSNFEKLVGGIDPNQSWDFSRGAKKSGTRTRGEQVIVPTDANGWYEIDQKTIKYLIDNLPEKENNKSKGNPFTLSAPDNGFAVIPLYQGGAAWAWELHMVTLNDDGTEASDENLWYKHENLECQLTEATISNDETHNIAGERDYSSADPTAKMSIRSTDTWYNIKQSFAWNGNNWANDEMGWNTTGVAKVRTKPIVPQTQLSSGQSFYFYLKVWTDPSKHLTDNSNHKASSIDHMMLYLSNCPSPTNLNAAPNGATKEVMVIGCEDDPGNNSDWDMNDFAFMIVGYPNVPIPHDIVENEEIINKKRYMVEDLGSTAESDIDFNDIVIDLEEYRSITKTTSSTGVTNITYGDTKQRAKVWAMGGTLDFYFMLKNGTDYSVIYHKAKDVDDYKQMLNTKANEINYATPITDYFEVSGWNPNENNVAFLVCHNRSMTLPDVFHPTVIEKDNLGQTILKESDLKDVPDDGTLQLVNFPQPGGTPFIIAFDPKKQWRDERHAVCKHWLFGGEYEDGLNCPECGETVASESE